MPASFAMPSLISKRYWPEGGDFVDHAVYSFREIPQQAGLDVDFSVERFRGLVTEGAHIPFNEPFEREASLRVVDPSNIPLEVRQLAPGFDKMRCPQGGWNLLALGFDQCELDAS